MPRPQDGTISSSTLVLFAVVAACSSASPRPAPLPEDAAGATIAFVAVTVLPMDSERVLRDQTVVIRGDRIVAIGGSAQVAIPPSASQIDGRGKFLLPGLADMHVHLLDDHGGDFLLFLANGV